jgi:hypothetical protein
MRQFSVCKNCNKKKTHEGPSRSDLCKSCSIRKFHEENKKDCLIVEHKAGNRETQRVYKYRSVCNVCGGDRGYRFKKYVIGTCRSCSFKNGYHNGRDVNDNFYSIRLPVITPNQGKILTRSSYEHFYLEYLNDKKIDYLYEPKRFILSDGSSYLPDVFLVKENTFVELKGYLRKKDEERLIKFKTEYPEIKHILIRKKELELMGFNQNEYKRLFKIDILGKQWTYKLETGKKIEELQEGECHAFCDFDKNQIVINEESLNFETIIHELKHIYIDDIDKEVIGLDEDQFEEAIIEKLSKNLFIIVGQAVVILTNLERFLLLKKNISSENLGLNKEQMKKLNKGFKFINNNNKEILEFFKDYMINHDKEEE